MVPDRLVFRIGDVAGVRVRRGFRARLVLQVCHHQQCASSASAPPGTSVEWRNTGLYEWRDVDANNPSEVACVMKLMAALLPEQTRERSRITE